MESIVDDLLLIPLLVTASLTQIWTLDSGWLDNLYIGTSDDYYVLVLSGKSQEMCIASL